MTFTYGHKKHKTLKNDFHLDVLYKHKKYETLNKQLSLICYLWAQKVTFDLSYFIGKSHFHEDGAQNYLEFQSILKYKSK